jgi:hypothetical protein
MELNFGQNYRKRYLDFSWEKKETDDCYCQELGWSREKKLYKIEVTFDVVRRFIIELYS